MVFETTLVFVLVTPMLFGNSLFHHMLFLSAGSQIFSIHYPRTDLLHNFEIVNFTFR